MDLKLGDTVFFHALGKIGFGVFVKYQDHYLKYRICIATQRGRYVAGGNAPFEYDVTVAEEELISEAKYRLLVLAEEQQLGAEDI